MTRATPTRLVQPASSAVFWLAATLDDAVPGERRHAATQARTHLDELAAALNITSQPGWSDLSGYSTDDLLLSAIGHVVSAAQYADTSGAELFIHAASARLALAWERLNEGAPM